MINSNKCNEGRLQNNFLELYIKDIAKILAQTL